MKLSWKEVVDNTGLKIGITKANYYRDRYIEFFQYEGEGRNRKYSESAIEILQTIAEGYQQAKTYEKIVEELESKFGVDIVPLENNKTKIQQLEFMECMREIFREELRVRDEAILRLENKLDDVLSDNKSHDEKLTELIRLKQQEKQKENKSFFQKIFGKK